MGAADDRDVKTVGNIIKLCQERGSEAALEAIAEASNAIGRGLMETVMTMPRGSAERKKVVAEARIWLDLAAFAAGEEEEDEELDEDC